MSVAQIALVSAFFAGWVDRNQQAVITYLEPKDRVLRERLGPKRPRQADPVRRRQRLGRVLNHYYREAA